jgi:hypothetical protein
MNTTDSRVKHQKKASEQPSRITQRMLREYLALKNASQQLAELRELILDLLAGGAPVERGEFQVDAVPIAARRLSAAALEELLGAAEAKAIISSIAPTYARRLKVTKDASRDEPWSGM